MVLRSPRRCHAPRRNSTGVVRSVSADGLGVLPAITVKEEPPPSTIPRGSSTAHGARQVPAFDGEGPLPSRCPAAAARRVSRGCWRSASSGAARLLRVFLSPSLSRRWKTKGVVRAAADLPFRMRRRTRAAGCSVRQSLA